MKKIFLIALAALLLVSVSAACASPATQEPTAPTAQEPAAPAAQEPAAPAAQEPEAPVAEQPSSQERIVFGISFDTLDHPFWLADLAGMESMAEELGVELEVRVAQNDANVQNQQIEDLLASGAQAIICAAKDNVAILQAVQKCNEMGVPFIYNDRPIISTDDAIVAYGAATDNFGLAKMGWEWVVEYAKGAGFEKLFVLELHGDLADKNAIDRSDGFKEVMAANPDFIELVQTVPTEWNMDKSLAGTTNALQSNPEVNCIYMHSDLLLEPTISALRQANRYLQIGEEGKVILMPFGGSGTSMKAVADGYAEMCFIMDIYNTGRLCVDGAYEIVVNGRVFTESGVDPGFILHKDNFEQYKHIPYGAFE